MKYVMWKTLQYKTEIRINLEETWKKKRRKEVNNQKETGKRLMTSYIRQQDGSVDSVRQESKLYIAEDNKVAYGSMDSITYCRRQ
jgi:hypothetical protein